MIKYIVAVSLGVLSAASAHAYGSDHVRIGSSAQSGAWASTLAGSSARAQGPESRAAVPPRLQSYDVRDETGNVIGADPDANIRFQIHRDRNVSTY